MKKIFSFTLLAVALLAGSCSKEKNDYDGPSPVQKKLKTTTLDEDLSFTYNADGTLKEINDNAGYLEKFEYEAGKIKVESFWNGKLTTKALWTLNNGQAVHMAQTHFDNMGQTISDNEYSFEFNAKGLLKKRISDDNSYEEYEYDANDDLIRETTYNSQGQATYKSEYEYGNQADLFPQYGQLRTNLEGFFLPALSKHLVVSRKGTPLPANVVGYHATYTYELDADGYVIKGTGTPVAPAGSGYSWTNTY